MNIWIHDSILLMQSFVSLLSSPAFLNICGCFVLLIIAKAFKDFVGG